MASIKLCGLLAFAALAAAPVKAADERKALSGSVVDPAGAPLPRTRVRAYGSVNDQPSETYADRQGRFQFVKLAPGTYKLTFTLAGFLEKTITEARLPRGEDANIGIVRLDFAPCNAPGGPICDDFGLSQSWSQPKGLLHRDAVGTLNRYIQLRLAGAEWRTFADLITWPDEPGWDCNWVSDGYKVGLPEGKTAVIRVPVTYQRLGLYCNDFEFKPEKRAETVRYEVVKFSGGWKIRDHHPEYPDLDVEVLIGQLQAAARDPRETPERRKQAELIARQLSAVKSRPH